MKVTQFSVSRYRSIIEAEKISLSESTVLIGKNNEGKSNILRAIRTAISAINFHHKYGDRTNIRGRRLFSSSAASNTFGFDWKSDFPIPLQNHKKGNKKTRFRIDFELNDREVEEFHDRFSLTLNSKLPISIEISSSGDLDISIMKPGKGSISFAKKTREICGYVGEKLDFVYVPAVRTGQDALQIVSDRLRVALYDIEENEEYKKAVEKIQAVQKPILDRISSDISAQLKKFIPSVDGVTIDTSTRRIYSSLSRDIELVVDDGVPTQLDAKGDGIKSLVALSLFHSNPTSGKSRIIAIEEPESHLHHGAVHELKKVLRSLAKDGQVILSTHNPSFVDRDNMTNVVLVEGGRAERVRNVERLRTSLGVLVSDNLVNSDFSIVCEGAYDARALRAIFSSVSPRLKTLIANGTIVFDDMGGGNKLNYKLKTLNRDVFRYYVILDHDQSGRSAVEGGLKAGVLSDADYSMLKLRGGAEAELEDAVEPDAYARKMVERYGIDIREESFRGNAKWSERMRKGFEVAGKIWNQELERHLKEIVCATLEERPSEKLRPHARDFFANIARAIEGRFAA